MLFRDRFSPEDFFPMVLNERVAWPKFMEMARDALFDQTAAEGSGNTNTNAGSTLMVHRVGLKSGGTTADLLPVTTDSGLHTNISYAEDAVGGNSNGNLGDHTSDSVACPRLPSGAGEAARMRTATEWGINARSELARGSSGEEGDGGSGSGSVKRCRGRATDACRDGRSAGARAAAGRVEVRCERRHDKSGRGCGAPARTDSSCSSAGSHRSKPRDDFVPEISARFGGAGGIRTDMMWESAVAGRTRVDLCTPTTVTLLRAGQSVRCAGGCDT